MSKRKAEIVTCDQCGLKVSDEGEIHFGGHPFSGWYHITMHGGPTDLASLRQQKEWDFCGKTCAIAFFAGEPPKKVASEDETWWGDPSSGPGLKVVEPSPLLKSFKKAIRKAKRKGN